MAGAPTASPTAPSASTASKHEAPPLDRAILEAERRLLWMRLLVSVTGTLVFPFVAVPWAPARWIGYALLAAGWLHALVSLAYEPALRQSVRVPSTVMAVTDAALTLLWVFATGGIDSPWFVAIYASIIWVSLRSRPRDTLVAAVLCCAGYLLMGMLLDQVNGHLAAIAIRIQFMLVVAAGSAIIARERLGRLTSRVGLLDLTQQVGQIGTWEWTVRDGVLTWSDELYRIFGVPRTFEPTFERYLASVHSDDRAHVTQVIEEALATKQPFRFDHRIVTPEGRTHSLHCRGRTNLGSDGEVRELVGSTQDITERKKMEAQLVLAGKLASLGTLASGVAHEINNPLAYVASNLELIDRQLGDLGTPPSPAQVEAMRAAVAAARHGSIRMRDIVQNLKAFSRVDPEGKQLVDLAHVADLAIEIVSDQLTKRARVVRDYAPMPPIAANESRLSQVFMNLLVNAAQAIERGGVADNEIRVRLYLGVDGGACFEVADTGSGIAPEHLGRLFDPFFTTKKTGEGTGLGLSICHGIVRDLGGEIRVATTGDRGTTFRVSLPVAESTKPERVPSEPVLPKPKASSRRSVCIIDDEARYAESLRLLLGYDHDVTLATCAESALALLAEGATFDVILCDLMMPGKTGMDLYEALATEASPACDRMVFITGGATSQRAREFLARPDIRHVEKPVEVADLHALIEEVASLQP